jgi:D-galactarolactone isomerase
MTVQNQAAWDCHTHVFDDPARRPVVAGSGYEPPVRTWQDLARTGAPHGVERFVLVQPSVYGSDNSLLLDELGKSGGAGRGVLVFDDSVADADLEAWWQQGARGIRFNAVSGSGNGMKSYASLAPRLRDRGWHAQFFVPPSSLFAVQEVAAQEGPNLIVDHLGGAADGADYEAARTSLFRLLDTGRAWVKASGFYRYGFEVSAWPDHFGELLRTLGERYPERVVWASDWPHTWFFDPEHGKAVAYADLLGLLRQSVSSDAYERILRANPLALYA